MHLNHACINILDQLNNLVTQIREEDYSRPIDTLSNSTIGQHLRHTLEFFICLEQGYSNGTVNYDKRSHDKLIETDKFLGLNAIARIKEFVIKNDEDKRLELEVGYDLAKDEFVTISTNYLRELVYNIEHAVHHMALIKIGVREAASYVRLPAEFGIAASTIRYKESVEASRQ
ncbi:MAG TPA: DinB family protein [Cyclobacteriaceae bacterium]|nr:DinB family protein [Cyclobacteriaceae bacterium]